jgi:branched-subunit amino acid transport protein
MSNTQLWLVVIGMGLITVAQRLSFILLAGRLEMPPLVRRGLRYVPPAVLTAIIFPELFLPEGYLHVSLHNPRLLAGFIASLVAWRSGNILFTLAAGMVALWLLQFLLSS